MSLHVCAVCYIEGLHTEQCLSKSVLSATLRAYIQNSVSPSLCCQLHGEPTYRGVHACAVSYTEGLHTEECPSMSVLSATRRAYIQRSVPPCLCYQLHSGPTYRAVSLRVCAISYTEGLHTEECPSVSLLSNTVRAYIQRSVPPSLCYQLH